MSHRPSRTRGLPSRRELKRQEQQMRREHEERERKLRGREHKRETKDPTPPDQGLAGRRSWK